MFDGKYPSILKLQRLHPSRLGIDEDSHPAFIMDVIAYPCWD